MAVIGFSQRWLNGFRETKISTDIRSVSTYGDAQVTFWEFACDLWPSCVATARLSDIIVIITVVVALFFFVFFLPWAEEFLSWCRKVLISVTYACARLVTGDDHFTDCLIKKKKKKKNQHRSHRQLAVVAAEWSALRGPDSTRSDCPKTGPLNLNRLYREVVTTVNGSSSSANDCVSSERPDWARYSDSVRFRR